MKMVCRPGAGRPEHTAMTAALGQGVVPDNSAVCRGVICRSKAWPQPTLLTPDTVNDSLVFLALPRYPLGFTHLAKYLNLEQDRQHILGVKSDFTLRDPLSNSSGSE